MNAPLNKIDPVAVAANEDPFQRSVVTGYGVKGPATGTITYDEIVDRAFAEGGPLCKPKLGAVWFIPSQLAGSDARNFGAQRERGEFGMLVLDVDEGGHSIEAVAEAVGAAVGHATTALIHSTKSSTAAVPRWRIVVPLLRSLSGADYEDTASALCERIEEVSDGLIVPDQAVCRAGQIAFLPNLPDGDSPFYECRELGLKDLAALDLDADHPIIKIREERRATVTAVREGAAAERERRRRGGDAHPRSLPIDRFNSTHRLADLLSRYGYDDKDDGFGGRSGYSEHWRSPYQRSRSYATRTLFDEKDGSEYWVSLSGSDKAAGLGSDCSAGCYGDAFDLFKHFEHGGDQSVALAAWKKQCHSERYRTLAEEILKKRAVDSEGDPAAATDPAEADRLAALGGIETNDASLTAGWLAGRGDHLMRLDDGSWRYFESGHWRRLDDDGVRAAISPWLRDLSDVRLAAAQAALESGEIDRKTMDKARSLRTRLLSTAQLEAIFRQVRATASRAALDSFDGDPHLLGIPGGKVIDLRTGEERLGLPGERVSLSTAVSPAQPRTKPEQWLRFIDQIADGRDGWDHFLPRLAGYALTGSTSAQSMFFLFGGGSNGKSVFKAVLRAVVGNDYGRTASSDVFLRSHGSQHPTGLASLAGARMVLASELPHGRVWNDELVKDITGGEVISARFCNQDMFSFTPRATVIVAGNHRPSFANADEAMARRMVLIELRRVFEQHEIVPNLAEKLLATEAPAILRWMIEGAVAWYAAGGGRKGLLIPPDVLAAGRKYLDDEDRVLQFLVERQLANPAWWQIGGFIDSDSIYQEFRRWMEDNGHKQWTKNTFGKELARGGVQRYGLVQKRNNAGRGYTLDRLVIAEEEYAAARDRIARGIARLSVVGGHESSRKEVE